MVQPILEKPPAALKKQDYIFFAGHEKTGRAWAMGYLDDSLPLSQQKTDLQLKSSISLDQSIKTWKKVTLSQFSKSAVQTNKAGSLAQAPHREIQAKFWLLQEEIEHSHGFLHN